MICVLLINFEEMIIYQVLEVNTSEWSANNPSIVSRWIFENVKEARNYIKEMFEEDKIYLKDKYRNVHDMQNAKSLFFESLSWKQQKTTYSVNEIEFEFWASHEIELS